MAKKEVLRVRMKHFLRLSICNLSSKTKGGGGTVIVHGIIGVMLVKQGADIF
jgi:hypothetical protein